MMRSLFYVIGPSGSGKDSLIQAARQALDGSAIAFAHRYITRPVRDERENFVFLSEAEFLVRQQHGLFWQAWTSHQLHYGIGSEVLTWLQAGLTVVLNGSRAYLPQAQAQCEALGVRLVPVWVHCDIEMLEHRLRARARESEQQIQERLVRATQFCAPHDAVVIDNSGTLEHALTQWLPLLRQDMSL